MAAYFKTTKGNFTWHVGFPPFNSTNDIKDVLSVQIDGHEADFLYGLGIKFQHDFVNTLTETESKIYSLLIYEMYRSRSIEECVTHLNYATKRITNPINVKKDV